MKTLILIAIAFVIGISCLPGFVKTRAQSSGNTPAQSAEDLQPKSRLVGVVLDRNDAVVIGAAVRVNSGTFKRRVKSDGDGRFEMELPAGCYELTAERPGFRKFRLNPFQVRAGTRELINIHLELAPPELPLKVHFTRKRAEGAE
jgi:hypothetical protein